MLFPCVEGFVKQANKLAGQARVRRLHNRFSDLVCFLSGFKSGEIKDDIRIGELEQRVQEFERL